MLLLWCERRRPIYTSHLGYVHQRCWSSVPAFSLPPAPPPRSNLPSLSFDVFLFMALIDVVFAVFGVLPVRMHTPALALNRPQPELCWAGCLEQERRARIRCTEKKRIPRKTAPVSWCRYAQSRASVTQPWYDSSSHQAAFFFALSGEPLVGRPAEQQKKRISFAFLVFSSRKLDIYFEVVRCFVFSFTFDTISL